MSTDSPSTKSPLEKLRIQRPAESPRRSGVWRWLMGLLLLLGVVVSGLYLSQLGAQDSSSRWAMIAEAMESKVEVRLATLTVERGQAADATVVATGYLESRRQAKIGARAPGRIETVKVEEGSRVTANEILAVLEHADLDASLAAAEAMKARAEGGEAYDQMIGEGNEAGNAAVQAVIDGLVDQTRSLERVIAALDLGGVTIEGSDSLDNPGAVFE